MICNYNIEEKEQRPKKRSSGSLVEKALQSKKYSTFTMNELHQFFSEQEIIHCIQFLQAGLAYPKLVKLYFLLFQVSARYGHKQEIYNFLCQFQFLQKLNKSCPSNCPKGQIIMAVKMAKFLDSYKEGQCPKIQLNSLISEYHQFRVLQSMKQSFIIQSCKLIEEYIYYHLNHLITQLEYAGWKDMDDDDFAKFYQHFCQLCTICKRVSYIKCSLLNLPVFLIPSSTRASIEEKNWEINLKKTEKTETNQELKVNESIFVPMLNVKRKLKAMNSMIEKMGQKL